MATCCEKERTTNYCPDCGADLKKGVPIYELQKYIRGRVRVYTFTEPAREIAEELKKRHAKFEAVRQGNYDKWNGWATALAELIALPRGLEE